MDSNMLPFVVGFLLLALFLGSVIFSLYKLVQCSLLEYMFILTLAGAPIGILLKFNTPTYEDQWYSVVLLGLCISAMIIFGSVKGLRWALRCKISNSFTRFWLILLGCLLIPSTVVLAGCIVIAGFEIIQFLFRVSQGGFDNQTLCICFISSGILAYACWLQEQRARKIEGPMGRRQWNPPE